MLEAIAYAEHIESEFINTRERAAFILESHYDLANDEAKDILAAFRPPK
ncbi:MAG: hypothetical protein FWG42_01245 [Clostridiales bacterium]|nr:hypothetical protein [Clostridiales bacterium]